MSSVVISVLALVAGLLTVVTVALLFAEEPTEEQWLSFGKSRAGKILTGTAVSGVLIGMAGFWVDGLLWVGAILMDGGLIAAFHLARGERSDQ